MKLNFWQTVGLFVIVVGAVLVVIQKMSGSKPTPATTAPTVAPAR